MSKRSPHKVDTHVGARLRMRRLMLRMSQTKLAEALGLTFQQIQKYEKGTNRIGAGRLQEIADIMEVPISFFFDGTSRSAHQKEAMPDHVTKLMTTREGLALSRAFAAIEDKKLRQRIVDLIEQITANNS